jgi:hypothetical protein
MAENWNCLITLGGSLTYQISTKSVKPFMGYKEKSIYDHIQIKLYYGPIWLKIRIASSFWWKSFKLNFIKICKMVFEIYGKVHLWSYVKIGLYWDQYG